MNADAKILQIMLSLRPALTTVNAPGALARFLAHMYVHGRMKIDEEDIFKSRIAAAVNVGLGVLVEHQSEQDWRLTDTGRAFVEANSLFSDIIQSEPSAPFVQPSSFMPADLAALAFPDESLADLKFRLLTDLTRLRSMAVGRLDMTDAERAMLTTLEGQVAQQWFSS